MTRQSVPSGAANPAKSAFSSVLRGIFRVGTPFAEITGMILE